jgi:hypothetical protein
LTPLGLWQIEFRSTDNPGPRTEHTMVLVDNILILMGGFDDNIYFDDTW